MEERSLYLECNSGISGDMTVAALIDAGADRELLEKVLASIPAKGFSTKISRVNKNGIDCADFDVILDPHHENHDHDMEYLFGHTHEENHSHQEERKHHEHHNEHRNLSDVLEIISRTEMPETAKKLAEKIFRIIAEAEAKAHGKPLEEVHFHEVGAIDSIVDVIAMSVCFESLKVNKVFVPCLCEGSGSIRCQHGILPVPVPAVLNIAEAYGLPLKIMEEKGEFVTPTGAAFVAAVMTDKTLPETFIIKKTGLGAGKRSYEKPSILRAMLIESDEENQDSICKLETNLDDCTGETLGFVMEELFSAGARDVHFIPCQMKKNRPGFVLTVICSEKDRSRMEEIIFRNTSTIGIRRVQMQRTVLKREEKVLKTKLGEVRVKTVEVEGKKRVKPEYEDMAQLARKTGKSLNEVIADVQGEL